MGNFLMLEYQKSSAAASHLAFGWFHTKIEVRTLRLVQIQQNLGELINVI
jgi:hypothetical protein